MICFDVLSTGLAVVAFALHVTGTIFPHWWCVEEEDALSGTQYMFYYGIWAIRECTNGSCEDVRSQMHGDRAWLIGPAVLVILAGVLLLISLAISIMCLIRETPFKSAYRKLVVLLGSGAGGVIILAVLIFYKKKAGLHPSYAPETSEGDPDWALFLSTFGGITGIINSLLIGCCINHIHVKSKERWLFGVMRAEDMEIDVNALRRGSIQGKRVTKVTMEPSGSSGNLRKSSISLQSNHM